MPNRTDNIKTNVDNAVKALKSNDIANNGEMLKHIQLLEKITFDYFELQSELLKVTDRKEYYKHEYFAECDRAEELNKALDSACDYLALMEAFRKPLSKQDWLKSLKELHNGY